MRLRHYKKIVHDLFDAIACYDDVAQGKPHPDMLHKLLDELQYKSHEALFIGDGPRDEWPAKAQRSTT